MAFYIGILPILIAIFFTTILYLSPKVTSILANLQKGQFEYIGKETSGFDFQRFMEWHTIVHRLERRKVRQMFSIHFSFWSSIIGAVTAAILTFIVSSFSNFLPIQANYWCKVTVGLCLLFAVVGLITPANLVLRHQLGNEKESVDKKPGLEQ